jgi:hypothetical protein
MPAPRRSRLQRRLLAYLLADHQRTRGTATPPRGGLVTAQGAA